MNPPIAKSATHCTTACCKEWLFGPLRCQLHGFNARKPWGHPYLHGSTTLLRPYCYGSATVLLPWASRCPWEQYRSTTVAVRSQHGRTTVGLTKVSHFPENLSSFRREPSSHSRESRFQMPAANEFPRRNLKQAAASSAMPAHDVAPRRSPAIPQWGLPEC